MGIFENRDCFAFNQPQPKTNILKEKLSDSVYEINTLNNVTQGTVQQNAKQLRKIYQIFFNKVASLLLTLLYTGITYFDNDKPLLTLLCLSS